MNEITWTEVAREWRQVGMFLLTPPAAAIAAIIVGALCAGYLAIRHK